MTCTNSDHYPQPDGGELGEAHLHAAGRVALVDGVPAVVDGSACTTAGDDSSTITPSSPRKWRTICVDPPWNYRQKWLGGTTGFRPRQGIHRRGAAANYSVMGVEDIASIPVGEWAEPEAHLYIWTTNAFMVEAHGLCEAWGFDQKTILTWVKNRINMGFYYRNNTEHVVFAVRGALKTLRNDQATAFHGDRGKHSEKPQAFYDMVETMSPPPYLDVFARKQRMGWDCYGNEVYCSTGTLDALTSEQAAGLTPE